MPQVYWSSTHPTEALYGTLGRFSYLLMHRKWLKDFVLSGDYSYFTIPESEYAYVPATADRSVANYLADPAGYQESVNSFDGLITDDREQEPFSVASENDHYFRETLALAKAYGVPVFWLTPPASETLARVDEVNGYYDDLADYLAPFVQSGELIVLQLRPEVYADKNFTDSVHPTATATLRYSCTMRRYASVIADNIGVEIEWRLPKDQTSSLSGAMIRSGDALAARDWTSRCFDSSTQTSAVVDASLDVGNQP